MKLLLLAIVLKLSKLVILNYAMHNSYLEKIFKCYSQVSTLQSFCFSSLVCSLKNIYMICLLYMAYYMIYMICIIYDCMYILHFNYIYTHMQYIVIYILCVCLCVFCIPVTQLNLLHLGSHTDNQIYANNFKIESNLRICLLVTFFILK